MYSFLNFFIFSEFFSLYSFYDEWIEYIEDRPYNDQRYYISNQKLKDLGWTISVKFEDGLYDLIRL